MLAPDPWATRLHHLLNVVEESVSLFHGHSYVIGTGCVVELTAKSNDRQSEFGPIVLQPTDSLSLRC